MLYQCGCDNRVVDIPTKLFFMIGDDELDRLCTEGSGCQIGNPFYNSYINTKGVDTKSEMDSIVTSKEYEQRKEEEYEEDDNVSSPELNLPPGYYEE